MTNQLLTRSTDSSSPFGFITLFTLALVALQLTGIITVPWVWVVCPLWISRIVKIAAFTFSSLLNCLVRV